MKLEMIQVAGYQKIDLPPKGQGLKGVKIGVMKLS
jgi:hypothetical protein